jgi:hypothetical protein
MPTARQGARPPPPRIRPGVPQAPGKSTKPLETPYKRQASPGTWHPFPSETGEQL